MSNFTQMSNAPDLFQVMAASKTNILNGINCVKVAIVQEFFPENLTVSVRIVNKKLMGLNKDGSQILQDYPLIYARICYAIPYQTFPIKSGMECLLFFNDREIESWFINGDVNPLAYTRTHDLSDGFALFGIRSIPNMINILADCLNLFYGNSNIAISNDLINITASKVQASNFQAMNGANGNIVDSQGKTLAKVEYGIITEIY